MTFVKTIFASPGREYNIEYPCVNTSDCSPIELNVYPGTYQFELWGAGLTASGGYVSGDIHFYDHIKLYLYIGGQAQTEYELIGIGGYNGGGTSQTIGPVETNGRLILRSQGGDGATDIRLNTSLYSRILVAGGAGGGWGKINGGYGGGFVGGVGNASADAYNDVSLILSYGGTQTQGGTGQYSGKFGIGATSAPGSSTDIAGCGGGGWFGGGSGYHSDYSSSGAGGSSFINGNPQCNRTSQDYLFYHSFTIPGNELMPVPYQRGKGQYLGNGFARITCIDPLMSCKIYNRNFRYFIIYFFIVQK